jgi:hypothetical protein
MLNVLITLILYYFTYFKKTVVVGDKMNYSSGKYTSNTVIDDKGIVYGIAVSVPLFYFTGSETFLELEKGVKYEITGFVIRIPILGMYPNILTLRRVA